jgi:hypothetical protein
VGWAVIVGVYAWGAERWAAEGGLGAGAARRAGLAAGSVLALVAVGGAWRGSAAESAFDAGRSWLVWALLLVAAAGAGLRGRGARQDRGTLGDRLGAAPGLGAVLVFAVLMTAFAADAALLRDASCGAVALGSVLALAPVLRRGARAA